MPDSPEELHERGRAIFDQLRNAHAPTVAQDAPAATPVDAAGARMEREEAVGDVAPPAPEPEGNAPPDPWEEAPEVDEREGADGGRPTDVEDVPEGLDAAPAVVPNDSERTAGTLASHDATPETPSPATGGRPAPAPAPDRDGPMTDAGAAEAHQEGTAVSAADAGAAARQDEDDPSVADPAAAPTAAAPGAGTTGDGGAVGTVPDGSPRDDEPESPVETDGLEADAAGVVRSAAADAVAQAAAVDALAQAAAAGTVRDPVAPPERDATVPAAAPNGKRSHDFSERASSHFARPLPRVLAIANQKGGVGKTTTAVNLGACLAELGYRVLVVDLDPQGNASTGLGVNPRNLEHSMYDVVLNDLPIEDCIEPTSVRNLFVAPASLDLAGAEIELVPAFSRELKLRRALEAIDGDYDFTLIDCPPSLGLLTVNGLAAATELLVPIQCEYYALEGLSQLLRNTNLVQRNLNPRLELSAIVLVMYDARTKLSDQVVQEVRQHFADKVCRNVVPRTVRLSEAPSFGQPIISFDASSRGAIAYRELAKEVSGGAP